MEDTVHSTVLPCAHCGEPIYWHRCEHCGLCYVGSATPACPSCDDPALDDLELSRD